MSLLSENVPVETIDDNGRCQLLNIPLFLLVCKLLFPSAVVTLCWSSAVKALLVKEDDGLLLVEGLLSKVLVGKSCVAMSRVPGCWCPCCQYGPQYLGS